MENNKHYVGFDIPNEIDENGFIAIHPFVETNEGGLMKRELDKSTCIYARYGCESDFYFDSILRKFNSSVEDICTIIDCIDYELNNHMLTPAERYETLCKKVFWENLIKKEA